MNEVITLTGSELVFGGIAVVALLAAVWLAGRLLLATAVIVGIEWLVTHYAVDNLVLLLAVFSVPALLAGHVVTEAVSGNGRRSRRGRQR
jgi:hypothetical protein